MFKKLAAAFKRAKASRKEDKKHAHSSPDVIETSSPGVELEKSALGRPSKWAVDKGCWRPEL